MINSQVLLEQGLTQTIEEVWVRVQAAQKDVDAAQQRLDEQQTILNALHEEQRKEHLTTCHHWGHFLSLEHSPVYDQAWNDWCALHALSSEGGWVEEIQQRQIQIALNGSDAQQRMHQKQALLEALEHITPQQRNIFYKKPFKIVSVMVDYVLNEYASFELWIGEEFYVQRCNRTKNTASCAKFDTFDQMWAFVCDVLWFEHYVERDPAHCAEFIQSMNTHSGTAVWVPVTFCADAFLTKLGLKDC